jgi:hypothetical protein
MPIIVIIIYMDVINPGPVNDIRRRARNSVYGPVNQSFLK